MYTCPSDDLHILYADGEMPAGFIPEYETHIRSCQKCAAKLKRIQSLNSALREDAAAFNNSIHFSQDDLDRSFEKLRLKLSFKEVTEPPEKSSVFNFNLKGGLGYFAAGIAAALAIVFVVPGGEVGEDAAAVRDSVQEVPFTPVARTGIMSTANQVKLDGTLDASALNAILAPDAADSGADTPETSPMYIYSVTAGDSADSADGSLFIMSPQYASSARTASDLKGVLTSYDVFAILADSQSEASIAASSGGNASSGQSTGEAFSFQIFLPMTTYEAESEPRTVSRRPPNVPAEP